MIAGQKVSRETKSGLVRVAALRTLGLRICRGAKLAGMSLLPEFHVEG